MGYGHGDSPVPAKIKPALTRWCMPGWAFSNFVAGPAMANTRIIYSPIFVEEDTTYIRVAVQVVLVQAGTTLDLRLFADNNGVPGALIEDFGNVSLANLAVVEIVISRFLPRGKYWLARRTATGAGAKINCADGSNSISSPFSGCHTVSGWALNSLLYVDGAWADPAPAPTHNATQRELGVYLREN